MNLLTPIAEVDDSVQALILKGRWTAGALVNQLFGYPAEKDYRLHRCIDRSLQRLRRKGRIRFHLFSRTWIAK